MNLVHKQVRLVQLVCLNRIIQKSILFYNNKVKKVLSLKIIFIKGINKLKLKLKLSHEKYSSM